MAPGICRDAAMASRGQTETAGFSWLERIGTTLNLPAARNWQRRAITGGKELEAVEIAFQMVGR
jgi:hypothetical protein